MDNILLTALLITSFICILTAYSVGVKHGIGVTRGVAPKAPIEAIKAKIADITTPKPEEETDLMPLIMGYSYDSAIEGIKKEVNHG